MADFFPSLGRGSGAFCILPGSRARLLVVTTADLWSSLAGAAWCRRLRHFLAFPPGKQNRRHLQRHRLLLPRRALVAIVRGDDACHQASGSASSSSSVTGQTCGTGAAVPPHRSSLAAGAVFSTWNVAHLYLGMDRAVHTPIHRALSGFDRLSPRPQRPDRHRHGQHRADHRRAVHPSRSRRPQAEHAGRMGFTGTRVDMTVAGNRRRGSVAGRRLSSSSASRPPSTSSSNCLQLLRTTPETPRAEDARLIYWTLELSANYGFFGG